MTYWLILFEENPPPTGPIILKITLNKFDYTLRCYLPFHLDVPAYGNVEVLRRRFFTLYEKTNVIVCDVKKVIQKT